MTEALLLKWTRDRIRGPNYNLVPVGRFRVPIKVNVIH